MSPTKLSETHTYAQEKKNALASVCVRAKNALSARLFFFFATRRRWSCLAVVVVTVIVVVVAFVVGGDRISQVYRKTHTTTNARGCDSC